jgi:hypothetical protein
MMAVIVTTFLCTFERFVDILAPEKEAVNNQGADLQDYQFHMECKMKGGLILTAALAINIANAKVPLSLGRPYLSKAASSSTPSIKTSWTGYAVPLAIRSFVDMNGRDLEFQPFP